MLHNCNHYNSNYSYFPEETTEQHSSSVWRQCGLQTDARQLIASGGTACLLNDHKVSHARALRSINVKHGRHCGPLFLPEENLGEKISWSWRIIPRLLLQWFRAPHQWTQPEDFLCRPGGSGRGGGKGGRYRLRGVKPLTEQLPLTPISVNITPADVQGRITSQDAQPGRLICQVSGTERNPASRLGIGWWKCPSFR